MKISVISFTQKGYELSCEIAEKLQKKNDIKDINDIEIYTKCSLYKEKSDIKTYYNKTDNKTSGSFQPAYTKLKIDEWAATQMNKKNALIFIGACGIAVRAIAPSVKNKLSDSPVIVIDELGKFVIPILSGHMGGANELAESIADQINAVPVITTATDINEKFAVDVFAKENDLAILNKDGIAKVSAKVLSGEVIMVSVDQSILKNKLQDTAKFIEYPPNRPVDILISRDKDIKKYEAALYLKSKQYVIGIGCKKNTPYEKIEYAINKSLTETGIEKCEVRKIASIDIKKNEPGIIQWCRQNRLDFSTYTATELLSVEGEFSSSAFVQKQVGVDNVCERAAVMGCKELVYDTIMEHEETTHKSDEKALCDKANGNGKCFLCASDNEKNIRLVYKKHAYDGVTIAIASYGCSHKI